MARAEFVKPIVPSVRFGIKTQKCPNIKKRGKSLFIQDLPRYYKFMLFADYSSTAACAAAKRAMGTRKGEQLT